MFQKRSPITRLSLLSSREKEPVTPSLDGNEGCGPGTAQVSAQEGPGAHGSHRLPTLPAPSPTRACLGAVAAGCGPAVAAGCGPGVSQAGAVGPLSRHADAFPVRFSL